LTVDPADQQYANLGRDVELLRSTLVELKSVYEEAHAELNPFDEPRDIGGDFVKTLEECCELLEHNVHLTKNRAGIIQNIKWGLHTGPLVADLRSRLQFHTQALGLVTTPEDKKLQLRMYRLLAELTEKSRSPTAGVPESADNCISAWLTGVFEENVYIAPPVAFTTLDKFPFRDGCIALRRHFASLPPEDYEHETRAQFVLACLGLLKCLWLIKRLRATPDFRRRRVGSPFRLFISNVDVEVCHRLYAATTSGEAAVDDDELKAAQRADGRPFLIWDPGEERRLWMPWMPQEGEEELPAIPLQRNEKLLIFRKSLTEMRLVPIVESESGRRLTPYYGELSLNTETDKFLPLYTVRRPNDPLVAEVYRQNDSKAVRFELADEEAAWALHHSLGGYQIRADDPEVTWSVLRPVNMAELEVSVESRTDVMKGRTQVLQYDPLVIDEPVDSPATPPARAMSVASAAEASSISLSSQAKSVSPRPSTSRSLRAASISSQATTVVRERDHAQGTIRELQPPVPPAIVFYGHSGRTHTYLHLESRFSFPRGRVPCRLKVILIPHSGLRGLCR
jgi:hypothetical protein